MRVVVKQITKFPPLKVEITIESEQELCDLWHRFNINEGDVNKGSTGLKYLAESGSNNEQIWREINNHIERLKLRKNH